MTWRPGTTAPPMFIMGNDAKRIACAACHKSIRQSERFTRVHGETVHQQCFRSWWADRDA